MMNFTKIKKKAMIVGALIVALSAVGITYALLSSSSQENLNKFEGAAAKVNISVIENNKNHEDSTNDEEEYSKINKNDTISNVVKIKNIYDSNYPTTDCYIRVKFVPMIKNQDGDSIGQSVDLKYNFNGNSNKWVYDQNSDTYYYTEAVAPNNETDVLLESITLNQDLPKNTHLELQVMADAISAHPVTNLTDAWKLTANSDGNYFTGFNPVN